MAHSVKYYLHRNGLEGCPKIALSPSSETWSKTPHSTTIKKGRRRIRIEHTIEVFGQCLQANQCPGPFLGDEIMRCLNELREIRSAPSERAQPPKEQTKP